MRSPRDGSNLLLPLVLVVTTAVAFLPAPWRLGWQRDLARIVQVPIRPFTHAGVALGSWLRPAPSSTDGVAVDEATLETVIDERERAVREVLALRQEVTALTAQVAELQRIPPQVRARSHEMHRAHVTRRGVSRPDGPVELTLEHAGGRPVPPGSIAISGAVHVVGRTIGDAPTRGSVSLLPITAPETGWISANLYPGSASRSLVRGGRGGLDDPAGGAGGGAADADGASGSSGSSGSSDGPDGLGGPGASDADRRIADFVLPADPILIQLEPVGDGTFAADVDRDAPFEIGDEVRLNDARWPLAAQQMVIGTVESARTKDSEPLLQVLTIRPRVTVRDVATVTILTDGGPGDIAAADGAGMDGGGGRP